MSSDTVIVTSTGEVESGFAIPPDELTKLRDHLHTRLMLCEDALRMPDGTANRAVNIHGRSYSVGHDGIPEECEFCTHYAARILAKFEIEERS